MKVHVRREYPATRDRAAAGAWGVWVSLPEVDTADVGDVGESFVIGAGLTEAEARADAIKALRAGIAELQGPLLEPGTPDPRD